MMRRKSYGFTLIELLTVLTVIVVLTGIVLTAVAQARAKARQSACAANMHQVYLSLQTYVQDYDGAWPSNKTWNSWGKTHPELALCPAVRLNKYPDYRYQGVPGYALNSFLAQASDTQIKFPATTVVVAEELEIIPSVNYPDPCQLLRSCPYQGHEQGFKRHFGGCNYAFVDGHSKWHRPESVGGADPCGNDGTFLTFSTDPRSPTTYDKPCPYHFY